MVRYSNLKFLDIFLLQIRKTNSRNKSRNEGNLKTIKSVGNYDGKIIGSTRM